MRFRRTAGATTSTVAKAVAPASITRADRLDYIAEMTAELSNMARAANASLLVSMLDMAHLEASIRAAESHAPSTLKS